MKSSRFNVFTSSSLFALVVVLGACAEPPPAGESGAPKRAYATQTGAMVGCALDADCNDAKACTLDKCVAGACTHDPDPSKPGCCDLDSQCSDGKTCTTDLCVANLCVHDKSLAPPSCCDASTDCSDGIACTVDTCTLASHTCSFDDTSCAPTLTATAPATEAKITLATNGGTGSIDFAFKVTKFTMGQVNCYLDGNFIDSTDASPFTFSGLTKGVHTLSCVLAGNGAVELINPEARATVRVLAIAPCTAPTDCNDGSACSDQDCQAGKCVYTLNPSCCTDAYDCAASEQCLNSGKTTAKCSTCALDIDCVPTDSCTVGKCDLTGAKGACTFPKPDPTCCSSSDDPCDDGKPCTADSCNVGLGKCVHAPIAGVCCDASQCDDGDACTADQCVNAKCVHAADSLKPDCCSDGTNTACNDNNTCTIDACNVAKTGYMACSHSSDPANPKCCNPPQTNCNDNDVCTQDECVAFQCTFSPIAGCCTADIDCADSDVCTTHTCDLGTKKCVKTPLAGCCNTNADCGDGKACTTDICDASAHTCSHVAAPNCCDSAADCSDGKVCTVDACVNGQCVNAPNSLLAGCCDTLADCEDDNSCTTDACTANKCVHTAVGGGCVPAPVPPKILICPAGQVVSALTTQILPVKAKEVDPTKSLTFTLLSAPAYVTLPQASWSSNGAVYVSGLTIAPASGNDAGPGSVSIEISDGTLKSYCNFNVTVTSTGGYLIWKPTEVPQAAADAIKASIGKTGAAAQVTTDLSLYPDLTQFKAVFVTLGVYGSGSPFHYLNPSEAATLSVYLGQKGHLYVEGGDTWYDQGNPLAGAFGIAPLDSNTSSAKASPSDKLTGALAFADATVAPIKAYGFGYDQVDALHVYNNDNDLLSAKSETGTKSLLSNGADVLMVGHDGTGYSYRTIGSSVPLGGLTAGPDTADALMVRILYFFDNGFTDTPAGNLCTGVTCAALDQCHTAGTCDVGTGTCSNPSKSNGSNCSDGNACTGSDACQAGVCTGGAGVCATGTACTGNGDCASGVCTSGLCAVGSSSVVAITAGFNFNCAIRANGSLWCWGLNTYGTLGDGTQSDSAAPKQVGSATDWTVVAAGYYNTCGIRAGTLWCWGNNNPPTVGDGTLVTKLAPVQIGNATDWTTVSIGNQQACGIRGGHAYCWGSNPYGELGNGTSGNNGPSPTEVQGGASDWTSISAASGDTTCGIRSGSLWCWGLGDSGGLGVAVGGVQPTPIQVGSATDWTMLAPGAATAAHQCGQRGTVTWCWGTNIVGELGDGTTAPTSLPVQALGGPYTSLSVGYYTTCGIAGGMRYCWGRNFDGEYGTGNNTPVPAPAQVDGYSDWTAIAMGKPQSCGLRGGDVWCWGTGIGGGNTWTPTKVAFP